MIIVKAAAISKENLKYVIKFVEWGQVDLTKKLIDKLDVKEYFEWINVLPRKNC